MWMQERAEFDLTLNENLQWYYDLVIYSRYDQDDNPYWQAVCVRCPQIFDFRRGETNMCVHNA